MGDVLDDAYAEVDCLSSLSLSIISRLFKSSNSYVLVLILSSSSISSPNANINKEDINPDTKRVIDDPEL